MAFNLMSLMEEHVLKIVIDGNMYFGGINGFNVFNPDNIEVSKFKPKVIFDKFEVNGVNRKRYI